ncbi:MAG: DMT family transporter [Megasphaera sp.]|jgi:drug/metabolite transporter (DMT)-like permease|nr:DMT family transporter [Megasphaera sp.]MCH4187836.1 DMT family transporter [Megasphaera sp.]MCH4218093.1 DMT family transporter [Megasphaera sp.]
MFHTKSTERTGCIQVLLGSIIWGSIGVFVMYLDQNGSSPALTGFLRVSFSCLIMTIMTVLHYGLTAFHISRRALLACALLGLLCHGIYNVCYNLAIIETGVAISAVLLNTSPVFTAITACIFFSEKMTKTKIMALIINIGGCSLAATGGQIATGNLSLTGLLFGLASGFLYSLTPIIGRIAGNRCNAFVMSTYSYLFAALSLAIYDSPINSMHLITTPILIISFFYALIPTSIAYLLYYLGVQKIKETSKVPVIASIETIAAIAFGMVLFHEQLGIINSAGVILVLVSIVLMNKSSKLKLQAATT